MKSVVELADSWLELAYSSADSNANSAKVGVWVHAFRLSCYIKTLHIVVSIFTLGC